MTDFVLNTEPGRFEWKVYPPTIIIHGWEQSSGDTVTRVTAPGTDSVARITPSGDVSLVIHGAEGIGRSGETRVAKQLHAWLAQQGLTTEFLPGTDDRGEDRRLKTDDRIFNVQIVTVPADTKMWREARRSSVSAAVGLDGAVQWIANSIEKKVAKTTETERGSIILVLDAQHANPLTEPAVLDRFIATRGDPSEQHGFAGVWIVGFAAAHCARLGSSVL